MKHISQDDIDRLNAVDLSDPEALEDLKNTLLDKYVEGIVCGWQCTNPENPFAIAEGLQMGMARVEAAERGNPGLTVGLVDNNFFVAAYNPQFNRINFNFSVNPHTNHMHNENFEFVAMALIYGKDAFVNIMPQYQKTDFNRILINRIGILFYTNGHEVQHSIQCANDWRKSDRDCIINDLGQAEREIESKIANSQVINGLYRDFADEFLIEKEADAMGYMAARKSIGELIERIGHTCDTAEYKAYMDAFNYGIEKLPFTKGNFVKEMQNLEEIAERFGWEVDVNGKIVGGNPENIQTMADVIAELFDFASPKQMRKIVVDLKQKAANRVLKKSITAKSVKREIAELQDFGNSFKLIREYEINDIADEMER